MASYGRLVDESHIAVVVDQRGDVWGYVTNTEELASLKESVTAHGLEPIVFWRHRNHTAEIKGDVLGSVVQAGVIHGGLVIGGTP